MSSPRLARLWYPVAALSGWTAFVWLIRIKNALGDDDMSSGGRVIALVTSFAFIAGAGAVVWAQRTGQSWARRAAAGFAVVTSVYWVIRMVTIVARGHSLGFTLVHGVLAAISIGLAALVVRAAGGGIPHLTRTHR